jgi:hypothetical protein
MYIVFIVFGVSFIVCGVLCVLYFVCVVLCDVCSMCVVSYCSTTVTGKTPFEVEINNNK